MTRRWSSTLLLLGAALSVGSRASAPADGGWWGDLDKGQGVRLADIIEAPERHRGRALTFTCVFHQAEREFNPLRTRFNSERYDNVSVWPDGAALWKQAEFEGDFPFLYVARNHPQRDLLLRQETFARIEVTAQIEAVVDGSPFLELTAVRVTGHRLGRRVMDLMFRGEVHGRTTGAEGQTLAVENFQAALDAVPDLAPIYVTRIRERLAEALRNLGRNDEAARVLAGGSATSGLGAPALAPADEPLPSALPRGGSLPGEEVGSPQARPPESVSPSPPASATPRRMRLPGVTPAPPSPAYPPADATLRPGETFRPSLPGIPTDDLPTAPNLTAPARRVAPAPAPPVPRMEQVSGAPPQTQSPSPPHVRAPVVVDPPLPSPPAGGAPPPRKPRLAGVK